MADALAWCRGRLFLRQHGRLPPTSRNVGDGHEPGTAEQAHHVEKGASADYAAPRYDMVRFLPTNARSVLDVGCGSGGFGRLLREEQPDLVLWAVEVNPTGAEKATADGSYDRVLQGGFPQIVDQCFDRLFDCVFFNDVLEHLLEPGLALLATHSLLSSRGVVVASIPNIRCIDALRPLVISGEWRYTDYGLLDRTHLRFFTRKSMVRLFEEHGFVVEEVRGLHGRHGWKVRTLNWFARGRLDEFLFQQYALVARKG